MILEDYEPTWVRIDGQYFARYPRLEPELLKAGLICLATEHERTYMSLKFPPMDRVSPFADNHFVGVSFWKDVDIPNEEDWMALPCSIAGGRLVILCINCLDKPELVIWSEIAYSTDDIKAYLRQIGQMEMTVCACYG